MTLPGRLLEMLRCLLLASDHACFNPADGMAGEGVAILDAELVADMGAVDVHGSRTDAELARNLVVAFGEAD